MILITGASGMLGRYVAEQFSGEKIITLGRSKDNDIVCDLTNEIPVLGSITPETVVHCCGTEEDTFADELNLEGTRRLCKALENNLPEEFVYISSFQVYGEEGEDLEENNPLNASSCAGKSKARAESFLRDWSERNNIVLTILRPARMFGSGVKGETLSLFRDAVGGGYIHVRGVNSKISLVCALDVAKGVRLLHDQGGIYNVSDGLNPRFIDMIEAMTANAGGKKRMIHLPATWAEWIWRGLKFLPVVNRNLHPDIVAKRMKTLTLDGKKFVEKTGIRFFNTIDVIERTDPDYPYKEN